MKYFAHSPDVGLEEAVAGLGEHVCEEVLEGLPKVLATPGGLRGGVALRKGKVVEDGAHVLAGVVAVRIAERQRGEVDVENGLRIIR